MGFISSGTNIILGRTYSDRYGYIIHECILCKFLIQITKFDGSKNKMLKEDWQAIY